MLKFFFIILFFIISLKGLRSEPYWQLSSSPTQKNLKKCFFVDTLQGWIGGDSGIIFHTTNEGKNWTKQISGISENIESMYFVNERIGYALAWSNSSNPPSFYGTIILSTTNGGNNWLNYIYPDTNLFMNTIYFLDSANGFMGGIQGKIFYTKNAGINWTLAEFDSSKFSGFPVNDIKFYNSQLGFAAGGVFDITGVIWRTTNGGRNWKQDMVGYEPIKDLYIFDSVNSIAVGGDFEYGASKSVTTNSGLNWQYTEFGIFGIANSISFRTKSEGWISMSAIDSFLVTSDGGSKWNTYPTPGNSIIYDIQFIDERNGWAVGGAGVILKYNTNTIGVSNYNLSIPESSRLYQNFPNPFNPETKIRFDVGAERNGNALYSLVVYDALGKKVSTLINSYLAPGSYEFTFNGKDLPSGIYFYNLLKDNVLISFHKMALIR